MFKLSHLILVFLLFTHIVSTGQDKTAIKYANQLDSTLMKSTVRKLASKEFAGRKSGDEGEQLAAIFITNALSSYKISEAQNNSYLQNIGAWEVSQSKKYFNLDNFNYSDCYSYANKSWQDSVIEAKNIVFAGHGVYHSSYNDFANIEIEGKIVMVINTNGPYNKFGVKCHSAYSAPDFKYIESQKPKAILTIRKGFDSFRSYSSSKRMTYTEYSTSDIPRIQINELLANRLLEPTGKSIKQIEAGYEESCSASSFEFENNIQFNGDNSYLKSPVSNVVSIIEGSDLKDEFIVISAHFDHIGQTYKKEHYPGADDNASGVASILEISRILNKAKKAGKGPRRSIVIFFPTAEEAGLHGSKYYTNNPIFPLEKTIACVNIDMIGRKTNNIKDPEILDNYIYALTDPKEINHEIFGIADSINNSTINLNLRGKDDAKYSSLFNRSDHYSFHKKEIPTIFFNGGPHEDLHRTTDTADKIDFSLMHKRTKLVFLSIWDLANNNSPFKTEKATESVEEEFEFEATEVD